MICVQNRKKLYTKVCFEINKNLVLSVLVSNNVQNKIFYVEKNNIVKLIKNYNNKIWILKKYKE